VQENSTPLCDRCHKLLHHRSGVSINHPSIESIQNTILESPHKYNHIYHVIDAADFPMSLIPGLHHYFHLAPQRSLNRRSRTGRYYHGKKTEVSFIIARSDLLAPLKAQVDSLMPYLVSVLRDALGSSGKNIRLGNVRCVSAKRGWWTKELKERIWNRGGGGWMVGKVNVGKSQLFESVFPKGRIAKTDTSLLPKSRHESEDRILETGSTGTTHVRECFGDGVEQGYSDAAVYKSESLDSSSLLPPLPLETDYPAMPLVSALPGTTASPIRVPFGNGKGELVDLPGLTRGDLELLVQEPCRSSLVMRSRVLPEQQVMKPGQSLLLGGFIRITPVTPGITVLAYSFTPILSHLTSTEKAISIQTQERESGVQNISKPGVGAKISSAGRFPLKWDVTKQRSGPVTDRSAAGIKVDKLPYRVVSTDVLIEGCGWVELVAQVRKRELDPVQSTEARSTYSQEEYGISSDIKWPEVEVFSPDGKFIGNRRPLGAWMINAEKKRAVGIKSRPRRSMKGMKKKMKVLGTGKS
jgi:genetic interactor of prohibitins 3, mitochondrial